ncbi:MAG: hypothetical protein RLZZ15_4079, partial [Verrucomicrobiota bacterium]
NVGQTLQAYLAAGVAARYIGFEPNIRSAAFVSAIIRGSGLTDAELVPAGAWNRAGLAELFSQRRDATDSMASLRADVRPNYPDQSDWIVTVRLDDALAALRHPPISLIKIDVEGGELEVLQGMEGLLAAAAPPPVVCEVLPADAAVNLDAYVARVGAVHALLRKHGYRIHRLVLDDGGIWRGFAEVAEFPAIRWSERSELECDYYFLPPGRALPPVPAASPTPS